MWSKEATTRPGGSWTFRGTLGIAAEGNIDFAGISIWNLAVFPRIPSETRVSFVPILIEWMKRGGKIGRSAPFSAFPPLRRDDRIVLNDTFVQPECETDV
jgi:hypothetical protein